jgi:hypothetical protein
MSIAVAANLQFNWRVDAVAGVAFNARRWRKKTSSFRRHPRLALLRNPQVFQQIKTALPRADLGASGSVGV